MLVHYLTVHQLKGQYIDERGYAISIRDDLHPSDLKKYNFAPVRALSIVVNEVSFVHQELYTSQELPLAQFLYDAWMDVKLTFGVPELLVVDRNLETDAVKELLRSLCPENVGISFSNGPRFTGAKRSAISESRLHALELHPDRSTTSPLDIPFHKWALQESAERKSRSTPARREAYKLLSERQPTLPTEPMCFRNIPVEPWMIGYKFFAKPLEPDVSLAYISYQRNQYHLSRERRNPVNSLLLDSSTFQIHLRDILGAISSVSSLGFVDYLGAHSLLGLERIGDIWDENLVLTKQSLQDLVRYVEETPAFFLDIPLALDSIASFLGAEITRIAELSVPMDNRSPSRVFASEFRMPNTVNTYFISINLNHFPNNDFTLDGKPNINSPEFNSHDFLKALENQNRHTDNYEISEQPAHSLEHYYTELEDNEAWVALSPEHIDSQVGDQFLACLSHIERGLVIDAFTALVNEREAAYRSAFSVCASHGYPAPSRKAFAIDEAKAALAALRLER